MTTVINGSYPAVNSDSDATINGLTVGKGGGAGANNTALGYQALNGNISGVGLFVAGYQAGLVTTGSYSTFTGFQAGKANTSGENTAYGANALLQNTTGTANTALGGTTTSISGALASNTTGGSNVGVGVGALASNTTASNNTAVGYQALYSYTTNGGNADNTALGYRAGYSSTTGVQNVFVGSGSGAANTTSSYNAFLGFNAGYNSTGGSNAFFGYYAGNAVTTGSANSFLGYASGYLVTTGSKNTIVGAYNGNQGSLDIRTASNYIVLSDGDGNPRGYFSDTGRMFINTTTDQGGIINAVGLIKISANGSGYSGAGNEFVTAGSNSYDMIIGNNNASPASQYSVSIRFKSSTPNNTSARFIEGIDASGERFYFRSNGGLTNYQANNTNLSDAREKKDFEPAINYLDKICAIPVQTFRYIDQTDEEKTLGVVAQDVQAVAPELIDEADWSTEKDGSKMRLSIYQTDLQYALMKAIQELNAKVTALETQLAAK